MSHQDGWAEETKLRTAIVGICIVLAGVVGLLLSTDSWFQGHPRLFSILVNISGLLIPTGALAVAWEVYGRKKFAEESFKLNGLTRSMLKSGLVEVSDDYLADRWKQFFKGSKEIDIVSLYAGSWRAKNLKHLEKAVRDGAHLRAFLPDVTSPAAMEVLAARLKTDVPVATSRVQDAIDDYLGLLKPVPGKRRGSGAKGRVSIYLRGEHSHFTLYRADNKSVFTLYTHEQKRHTAVPMFRFEGGWFGTFAETELRTLVETSTLHTSTTTP
jgi:hypothetical protein